MPKIVPCGSRRRAYEQFLHSLERPRQVGPIDIVLLLVDSEAPVAGPSPWEHVKNRQGDGWKKPLEAEDDHLHLMVQCMETWFLADRPALEAYFGQGFRDSALPAATAKIEDVGKADLLSKLKAASKDSQKGGYDKGKHSFKLLATLDPEEIRSASPWAERFFSTLDKMLGDPGRS